VVKQSLVHTNVLSVSPVPFATYRHYGIISLQSPGISDTINEKSGWEAGLHGKWFDEN